MTIIQKNHRNKSSHILDLYFGMENEGIRGFKEILTAI